MNVPFTKRKCICTAYSWGLCTNTGIWCISCCWKRMPSIKTWKSLASFHHSQCNMIIIPRFVWSFEYSSCCHSVRQDMPMLCSSEWLLVASIEWNKLMKGLQIIWNTFLYWVKSKNNSVEIWCKILFLSGWWKFCHCSLLLVLVVIQCNDYNGNKCTFIVAILHGLSYIPWHGYGYTVLWPLKTEDLSELNPYLFLLLWFESLTQLM